MLLGILSDTHNHLERTQRAVEMLRTEGATALVHCGDLTGAPIVRVCASLPCYFVLGNNDDDNVPELEQAAIDCGVTCLHWGGVVELAGKRVGVVHGHMSTDLRRILNDQPDYLLSGHSHYPADTMQGTVRRINPGALFRAAEFTVALLDLSSDTLRFLKIPR